MGAKGVELSAKGKTETFAGGGDGIHYMELQCGGWGSPIYAMVGVTCLEETAHYNYVTYPPESVVWCQDGKLAHEWWYQGVRRPHRGARARNASREYQYNDRVGVLVDRRLARVGFVLNGKLLPDLTVHDLPLDRPCRFIASLYDAGAELIFSQEHIARWRHAHPHCLLTGDVPAISSDRRFSYNSISPEMHTTLVI